MGVLHGVLVANVRVLAVALKQHVWCCFRPQSGVLAARVLLLLLLLLLLLQLAGVLLWLDG